MARNRDDTQEKLLNAARGQFAALGFDRTTVRSVAAEAEVDAALVIRYFGNKEGLFAAAAAVDLSFPDLLSVPREQLGTAMVRHFIRRWEGPDPHDILRVLIRSAAINEVAAQRMREIFSEQVAAAVAMIASPKDARVRALLIASQMLGLGFTRYVLKLSEPALDEDALARAVGPTIQRYLFGPLD